MAENIERELGWDESIENDGPEFVLLPDGEYPFRVEGLERKRFNGSDKLPACPMAENIAKGRLNKFLKENCLLSQEYIWEIGRAHV